MNIDITQDTLTDNKAIFERICHELNKAKKEILVAMAWFTDPEIFQILLNQLDDGINVSLIISEQPDNEKLDFSLLEKKGGTLLKIKNVGYGMMHQKFCIIDESIAISGSYNWTMNARNNNHETVIFTNHQKTIDELSDTFYRIKERAIKLINGENLDTIKNTPQGLELPITINELIKKGIGEQTISDFKNVLDTIIAAEMGNFDKDLLRLHGYTRSKDNNGDYQILPQAMDSVYSNFINDIEVVDERKQNLKSKIEEQLRLSTVSLEAKISNEEQKTFEESRIETENIKKTILDLESQTESNVLEIKHSKETKIPFLKEKISSIRDKINFAERQFIKPPINWPAFILSLLMSIFLAIYIFTFYSSVAYIFIFGKEDANEMMLRGTMIESPEIFNPHVFEKINDKGLGGILFLIVFVAIPFGLALTNIFLPKNTTDKENFLFKLKEYRVFLGVIIIDVFIAFKVSANINNIEYITNKTDHIITFWEVFASSNFYLVFILGTLGVYLFNISFTKFFTQFEERNITTASQQNKKLVEQFNSEIEYLNIDIHQLNQESVDTQAKNILLYKAIERYKFIENGVPLKMNQGTSMLRQELEQGRESLTNLSNIYKSYIENDKLPISMTALDDRINVFLEGWSKFLHDTFSFQLAEKKTTSALIEIENWKKMKLNNQN